MCLHSEEGCGLMRVSLLVCGLATALSFGTLANATTATWTFASDPQQVANGTTYSTAIGSIKAYGEQVDNSTNNIVATPVQDGGFYFNGSYFNGTSTLSGLFSTDTKLYNLGSGIAPFDPAQGGSSADGFPNQLGINDDVSHNSPTTGSYGNILELQLGSDIASGTTLSFLLQGPTNDPVTGEATSVNVYYKDSSSVINPSAMTLKGNFGGISTSGIVP